MSATKTHLTLNLARECLPLIQDMRRSYCLAHPSLTPTDSAAIGYALYLVGQFQKQGGSICWPSVHALDLGRFNLPSQFPHDIRYRTGISRAIIPALDRFVDTELSGVFVGRIYRNLSVRLLLRAAYCLTHEGYKDVHIDAGDAAPADAPAAYDPYRLMFPYRSDPRNSEGFDPSIFDDLFPNGTNAEDSESEMF